MKGSQLERIQKAEKEAKELMQLAAQMRQDADLLAIEDPALRDELLETVRGLEAEAENLKNALRAWREDIN